MAVIGFNCRPDDKIYIEDVLPALLKGNETNWKEGKSSIIRPLFKDVKTYEELWGRYTSKEKHNSLFFYQKKDPYYKPGFIYTPMWKQRSSPRGSMFCCDCGQEAISIIAGNCPITMKPKRMFPKILRDFRVIKATGIGLSIDSRDKLGILDLKSGITLLGAIDEDIVTKDGFSSPERMLSWFDARYNLKIPKPFVLYEWEGIS